MPSSLGKVSIDRQKLTWIKRLYYTLRIKTVEYKFSWIKKKSPAILLVGLAENKIKGRLLENTDLENPFIAPFEILLTEAGIPFCAMDLENLYKLSPVKQVKANYNYVYAMKIYKMSNNEEMVNNLHEVEKFSDLHGIRLNGLADFLFKNILYNEIEYYYWKFYFKAHTYNKVLFYCYYHNSILALNRAARDQGILTIEYQHSLQSDNHFAYSKWSENLIRAKHHFPGMFWVWTEFDKQRIEANFNSLELSSNVFKGGNIYLTLLHKQYASKFKQKENIILIALQGFWIPDYIQQVIESDLNYKWFLRLHPRYPLDYDKASALTGKHPGKIFLEEANDADLYELLAQAKYVITAFSGVALEAQVFGCQAIIFSEDGYQSFKNYIEEGVFSFIKDKEKLMTILNSNKEYKQNFNGLEADKNRVLQNVIQIFETKN